MRKLLSIIGLVVFALGCAEQKFAIQPKTDEFGTEASYNTEVDVLWVVDNSGSMLSKQEKLSNEVDPFVTDLNKTGLNYRMAVTSTDFSSSGERGKFLKGSSSPAVLTTQFPGLSSLLRSRIRVGNVGSPVPRGLEAMKAALSAPNTDSNNKGFLRPESLLAVIFLTDDEDKSSTQDYERFLNQVKPPLASGERSWVVNVIGQIPGDSCTTGPYGVKYPSLRLIDLANRSNGVAASVCEAEFSRATKTMRARLLSIATEYQLAKKPNLSTIQVYINGILIAEDPENGWQYYELTNSIRFYGQAVPPAGSQIQVDYDPSGVQ